MRLDGAAVPERAGEIRACVVVRNEALRLPAVLDHHRGLGVDRFLVIDDGSTDGTLDLLARERDVHVFHGEGGYAAAGSGLAWINAVLDAHADGHWALTIDADELFVFPGLERTGLRELCGHLDAQGREAAMALMIDMFAAGDVSDAVHDPATPLTRTCPWFDPGPYRMVRAGPFPHMQFQGGVRDRLFDFRPHQPRPPVLTKVPLVKWRRGRRYRLSTHAITPLALAPMLAAILHFKFLSDFPARVAEALARRAYHGDSREYRAYADALAAGGGRLTLKDDRSVRYAGSDQLCELGLMHADAAWDARLAGAPTRQLALATIG
jgi:glycosyltransferase involved in cell wall biosynthesis